MANISVDYNELTSTANNLNSGRQEVEAQLQRLQGLVNQLIAGGFRTDLASGKFGEAYDQWTKGAQQMLTGLDGMSKFLNTAIAQHQQLDQTLSQGLG